MRSPTDRLDLPWVVEHVELVVELDSTRCTVTNRSRVVRTVAAPGPLVLDGRGLETISVAVDGRQLGSDHYQRSDTALSIDLDDAVASHEVTTVVAVVPGGPADKGITVNQGIIATNCEPQGFRRITWSQDRPDVRSGFDVTLIATRDNAPVLLAAGDCVESGPVAEGDRGRHFARFVDPVAKPTYLFALVAGEFETRSRPYRTASGRPITLQLAAPPELIAGSEFALATLEEMIRFDEAATSIEHDLDLLTFVALPGYPDATEYQGLMFFNPSLLVVDARGHVDDDLMLVLLNVAHEYGHHARGNRVTVASWQQLPLKEGLTVLTAQNDFRRHLLGPAARILEILDLRRLQYPEELTIGAPVLREEVADPTVLYTRTTYLKGAEIFEMLRTLLGADRWSAVLQSFLASHDRGSATVADFLDQARTVAANTHRLDAPPVDGSVIDGIAAWFGLAGRPTVTVTQRLEPATQQGPTAVIHLERSDGLGEQPRVAIPLRLGFFDRHGSALDVELAHPDGRRATSHEHLVVLAGHDAEYSLWCDEPPVVSPLRGWTAPVDLVAPMPAVDLGVLARHESDPVMRWWATQELMTIAVDAFRNGDLATAAATVSDVLVPVLTEASRTTDDPLLLAQMLNLPDEYALGDRDAVIDVDGVAGGLAWLRAHLGLGLESSLLELLERTRLEETGGSAGSDMARRALLEPVLVLLLATHSQAALEAAMQEFSSDVPTRSLRALTQLLHLEDDLLIAGANLDAAGFIARFDDRWGHVPGLVDRGIRAETGSRRSDTIERVGRLVKSDRYDRSDRGRVMAVWFPFATRNRAVFHDSSGAGYALFADELIVLLASDPGTVIRLVGDLLQFGRFDQHRSALMRAELERLAETPGLPDFAVGILRHLLKS